MTAPAVEQVDIAPYWKDIVLPTVGDVYRRWAEYVDRSDLEQEALAWWYGRGQNYLPAYLSEDENHVRLRRSIWRWCARYAQKEKAEKVGYFPADQYRYSAREIVDLVPMALDPDGVPERSGPQDGPKAKGNVAWGGDVLAALIDVRRAVSSLAEDDLHFLQLVYDLHADWDRAAELLAIQPDSARRRHTRLIERLARWLNNEENYL